MIPLPPLDAGRVAVGPFSRGRWAIDWPSWNAAGF